MFCCNYEHCLLKGKIVMLKQIITLFRGAATQASDDFTDRHALAILKQQLKDGAYAVDASRKAVAIAIAQNQQEATQHKQLVEKISDLESRTTQAIEQGKNKLALEAAETIALLEAEKEISNQAQEQFLTEITRLKNIVHKAELKLKELQRGQRLATATDQTQRLQKAHPNSGLSDLKDAQETLTRLRMRQTQIDGTADAIAEMEKTGDPTRMTQKLAEAGCGAPLKTSAQDVVDRLTKQKKKKS